MSPKESSADRWNRILYGLDALPMLNKQIGSHQGTLIIRLSFFLEYISYVVISMLAVSVTINVELKY